MRKITRDHFEEGGKGSVACATSKSLSLDASQIQVLKSVIEVIECCNNHKKFHGTNVSWLSNVRICERKTVKELSFMDFSGHQDNLS